jgi:Glycoside Hydrolase Family 113
MLKLLRKYGLLLVVLGLLLQAWLLSGHFPWLNGATPSSPAHRATPAFAKVNRNLEGPQKPGRMQRPDFQTGVIFPQWGQTAYGPEDPYWQVGLAEIQQQTAAQWIAMTINFSQSSPYATQVQTAKNTPTPQVVAAGIGRARAMGYHLFVQPLITIQGQHPWAGYIQFTTAQEAHAWFDSYWRIFKPYVVAAAQAGAEELALGTEYERLQRYWGAEWNQLISRVHRVFPGMLTYDINWTTLNYPIPSWMHSPWLNFIGVSVYISLTDVPRRLEPKVVPSLWREKIRKVLDAFSAQLRKPVLISEIGYRDSPDALYNPWEMQTLTGTDPEEQAAAYAAALQNSIVDPHITGIFFWAWSFPLFAPNGKPASKVLYDWYTSPLA